MAKRSINTDDIIRLQCQAAIVLDGIERYKQEPSVPFPALYPGIRTHGGRKAVQKARIDSGGHLHLRPAEGSALGLF
jgi:hypothetical protein